MNHSFGSKVQIAVGAAFILFGCLAALVWHEGETPSNRNQEALSEDPSLFANPLRPREAQVRQEDEVSDNERKPDPAAGTNASLLTKERKGNPASPGTFQKKLDQIEIPLRSLLENVSGFAETSSQDLVTVFRQSGFNLVEAEQELPEGAAPLPHVTWEFMDSSASIPWISISGFIPEEHQAGDPNPLERLYIAMKDSGQDFSDLQAWIESRTSQAWTLYHTGVDLRLYRNESGHDLWIARYTSSQPPPYTQVSQPNVFILAIEPSHH